MAMPTRKPKNNRGSVISDPLPNDLAPGSLLLDEQGVPCVVSLTESRLMTIIALDTGGVRVICASWSLLENHLETYNYEVLPKGSRVHLIVD